MDRPEEDELTRAVIELARQYGRYGYRRITALLWNGGWQVSKDRVQRIWRREGLKVPQKQRPRRRLWFNDGSCVRLRPERPNQAWSYDFVSARTHDGRTLRLLTLLDEYTRECLALPVERRMGGREVIETLSDVMLWRGIPEHIRSDNGPEFVARQLRGLGSSPLYIEPGSPWENGYCESFNGKLREECLNGEIFYSLQEARIVIEQWRVQYNTVRPHSALDYRPPAPGACNPFPPPKLVSQPQAVMQTLSQRLVQNLGLVSPAGGLANIAARDAWIQPDSGRILRPKPSDRPATLALRKVRPLLGRVTENVAHARRHYRIPSRLVFSWVK